MDWTFNEEIGILELSRASFPTLDEIVWQKIHSYSEKKKGRSGTEDKSSTRTSGVDTVHIANGSCRVSGKEKKTPSRLALAYVTHDDVVRTWRLSPGPDLSRIATQLSSDRIHDAVRFRIGMEGVGEGGTGAGKKRSSNRRPLFLTIITRVSGGNLGGLEALTN